MSAWICPPEMGRLPSGLFNCSAPVRECSEKAASASWRYQDGSSREEKDGARAHFLHVYEEAVQHDFFTEQEFRLPALSGSAGPQRGVPDRSGEVRGECPSVPE